jgi:hypothetical protein
MEATADLAARAVDGARSLGQTLRSAFTRTAQQVEDTMEHVTREPQTQPTHDGHTRTIQEVRALRRSRRSPQEQHRLDVFCEGQQPQTDVEAQLREHGVFWPELPADRLSLIQRWR